MKVLHINKSECSGGAAVAAVRLVKALRQEGTDASLLVLEACGQGDGIVPFVSGGLSYPLKTLRFVAEAYSYRPRKKGKGHRFEFSSARFGYDISRHPAVREADVLHLHWINQGFLSLSSLRQLLDLGKPVVWTLHDMWPFTGGCHYSGACSRFSSSCGQCPLLKSRGEGDLSARQFAMKREIYEKARMVWVGCSQWMSQMAGQSGLVRSDSTHDIKSVFNSIDTNLFCPSSQETARHEMDLPVEGKILLFGAANVNDPRKGIAHLERALQHLNRLDPSLQGNLKLVVFGKNSHHMALNVPYPVHPVDFVKTQSQMVQLYRAADVFVLPSLQDNLPNTVMESLACGTPVSAFQVGGVPEMIGHKQWGTLAPAGDDMALAKGLSYLLTSVGSEERQVNARSFVMKNCSPRVVATQYMDIYQSLI